MKTQEELFEILAEKRIEELHKIIDDAETEIEELIEVIYWDEDCKCEENDIEEIKNNWDITIKVPNWIDKEALINLVKTFIDKTVK